MSLFAQPTTQIQQAVQLFQAGQAAAAADILQKVLHAQPRNFDALHILGVLRAMQGQRAEAIELFRKALAINKNHSFLQFNMAKALSESGQDAEALVHHRRATQLAPDHAEAWLNFGLSLLSLEQYPEAIAALEKAIAANPQLAAAWSNLGLARSKSGHTVGALEALDRALTMQPDLAEAHFNKGAVLDGLQRLDEALASYDTALKLKPDYAEAWSNKGSTLVELLRPAEALACYERAIELNALFAQAWYNKGCALTELHQLEVAKASYLQDLEGQPDARLKQGSVPAPTHLDAAITAYRQAITLQPDYASAHVSLGQVLLVRGDFAAGWEELEFRWSVRDDAPQQLQTHRPRWTGAASDRPLLLWGEQGIGDQILYASILPELADFPQRKLVALDQRLIPLFARSMPGFEFIGAAQVSDALDFAEQLPLGSLPRYFRPSSASFAAARHPHLLADPARAAALRQKITQPGKLVCGVSWSSSRKSIGRHKSISLEQMLTPLASDKLHFVDLQYGDTREERQALAARQGIEVQHVDEIDNFEDVDGLAALIQACDIVITISNSTAHLAGALGKETLLLLPAGKGKFWYWAEFGGKNPWYPCVQTYAQAASGAWHMTIMKIKMDLAKRLP